ncbi:hypothetical protein H2201_005822 [Coniosporium apollinis]|uniref:Signal peptidase complex subunit 1 n=2 Tax=Coniosporium TaxID=2810619 RepID=A0ABQ9NNU4_9PEZI|nr:hypothetical protein H2199_004397 [Cladosporium sp. JES 115]KAJ9662945.1 hypothetical protein H2201_005822 [Coniosporium apollinis]
MADALLESVRDVLEGQIDFEGQRLAELLSTAMLATAGFVSFIVGYMTQNIQLTLWIGLAGAALTLLAVVPPWPFFNKNPIDWLPPQQGISQLNIEVDGRKVS